MRLALAFHEPDFDALRARMPDRVFEAWTEFDCYEPIGGQRLDWNVGSIVHHILRAAGKTFERVGSPSDYRLKFAPKGKSKRKSAAELEALLVAYARMVGAHTRRNRK